MKRLLFILALCLCVASPLAAQSPVLTQPYPSTSTNASSTITATGVFQAIWTLSTNSRGRAGCTIQNLSASNNMFVYFGAIAGALTTSSVKLSAGQALNCIVGGIVLQDSVSITGTTGDNFYAVQQ